MRQVVSPEVLFAAVVMMSLVVGSSAAFGQSFSYEPAGQLESGTQGRPTTKVWVPQMRFPVLNAPAYANSQVWGHGGVNGPDGSQCDEANYSYPWYDNYCEPRKWEMPLCPGGTGHQGQDIRPKTCSDATHWAVAAEAGTIIDDSGTAIKLKTASGRTHRYLHLAPSTVVVNVGDELEPGDKIGKISNYTGGEYPTTIHLHYDVRQYVSEDPKSGDEVGQVAYFPPYTSLVASYKRLIGEESDLYDAEMEVRILNSEDRYVGGESRDVPDFFPGETIEVGMYLQNAGLEAWPMATELGYEFNSTFLTPTDYRIDSDHPAHDRSSWQRNSADGAEANPSPDEMAGKGELSMHAFSSGETKRVTVELTAEAYSIGRVDHPDARGWLKRIDGLYGTQSGYFEQPTDTNVFGTRVRDFAQIDILSRDHWHFEGPVSDSLEGWSVRPEGDSLQINTEDGLLTTRVGSVGSRVVSPEWTRVSAEAWDELVVRLRSHDGPHRVAVYWAREGEDFSSDRRIEWEARGDSTRRAYVVPVGDHSAWTGDVTRLRVDLLEGRAPEESERGWYGLSDLFFQSSVRRETNSQRESYVEKSPVSADLTEQSSSKPDAVGADAGAAGGSGASESSRVSACSVAGPTGPRAFWLLILLMSFIGRAVRRGHSRARS